MIRLRDHITVVGTPNRIEPAQVQPAGSVEEGARWTLLLLSSTGVTAGSRITWRGHSFDVTGRVQLITDARGKAHHSHAAIMEPTELPDTGTLSREQPGGFDHEAEEWVEPGLAPQWSGPCLVDVDSTAAPIEIGEQQVSIQPFTVELPVTVVDVRPDDVFKVTASRDTRLIGRPLRVIRVEAGTDAQTRVIHAIDNQG